MEANFASHPRSDEINNLHSQCKPANRGHQGKRGSAETNRKSTADSERKS
jgi:hypothetical protein